MFINLSFISRFLKNKNSLQSFQHININLSFYNYISFISDTHIFYLPTRADVIAIDTSFVTDAITTPY